MQNVQGRYTRLEMHSARIRFKTPFNYRPATTVLFIRSTYAGGMKMGGLYSVKRRGS